MNDKNSKQQPPRDDEKINEAHEQAELDIEQDPELSTKLRPGDDLDEGELARLEGED